MLVVGHSFEVLEVLVLKKEDICLINHKTLEMGQVHRLSSPQYRNDLSVSGDQNLSLVRCLRKIWVKVRVGNCDAGSLTERLVDRTDLVNQLSGAGDAHNLSPWVVPVDSHDATYDKAASFSASVLGLGNQVVVGRVRDQRDRYGLDV